MYTLEQKIEQAITDLDLKNIIVEQSITDLDLRLLELEVQNG